MKEILIKIKDSLPDFLMVNKIKYKLHNKDIFSEYIEIIYVEFDGIMCNWNNKPIDLTYKITDDIPPIVEAEEGQLCDGTIYKLNVDDVISDCLEKMMEWHNGNYTVLNEIVTKETQFKRDLTALLVKYDKQIESDISADKLANYLIRALDSINFLIKNLN